MSYIEYRDEHATYRIERDPSGDGIDAMIEDFLIPVLRAAGYAQVTIDSVFKES